LVKKVIIKLYIGDMDR